MTECYLNYHIDDATPVKCDNCDWRGRSDQLGMISDIQERLDPGGVVPAGECPECGCFAYIDQPEGEPRPTEAGIKAADDSAVGEYGPPSMGEAGPETPAAPTPPAPKARRWYVTINWHDYPEGGTYGDIFEAADAEEAERLCRLAMADSQAEDHTGDLYPDIFDEYDIGEDADEDRRYAALLAKMAEHYEGSWTVVDCWDLDEFIERHRVKVPDQPQPEGAEGFVCPGCGTPGGLTYVEDIGCGRRVERLGDDGRLVIDGLYKTDGYDEDSANPRFVCNCGHEWTDSKLLATADFI